MKKFKRIVLSVLFIIFFCCMIFSLIKIISWVIDNINTNNEIRNVQDQVVQSETSDDQAVEVYGDSKYNKEKFLNVSFSNLKNINNEVSGWVKVLGTNIDYPFVRHNNNSYYLNHSFNKSYNEAGWVFLDYRCDVKLEDQNTILYAHGRVDGTMFGSLKDTLSKKWLNDDSNFLVKVSTPYSNNIYEVFSIYHIETTDDYIDINYKTDANFLNFIKLIKNRSVYDFSVNVSSSDKIITLSTCYSNSEKMVLHAKLIKRQIRK